MSAAIIYVKSFKHSELRFPPVIHNHWKYFQVMTSRGNRYSVTYIHILPCNLHIPKPFEHYDQAQHDDTFLESAEVLCVRLSLRILVHHCEKPVTGSVQLCFNGISCRFGIIAI